MGSEFVLECSSSFQGQGEAEVRIPRIPIFPPPLPHGSKGSSKDFFFFFFFPPGKCSRIQGKGEFLRDPSPSLPQLRIFREGSGTQPGFGLPWRPQTLFPGTGWPLIRRNRQLIN